MHLFFQKLFLSLFPLETNYDITISSIFDCYYNLTHILTINKIKHQDFPLPKLSNILRISLHQNRSSCEHPLSLRIRCFQRCKEHVREATERSDVHWTFIYIMHVS